MVEYWPIYNKIVVASNDNELSQVTLPGFSICVRVPVIRGLTRFLTIVAVPLELLPTGKWDFAQGEYMFCV